MPLSREDVARVVDHTLLRPEATGDDVRALCAEAAGLGVWSVCVSASRVATAARALTPGLRLTAVVGFPSGAHVCAVKTSEAAVAVEQGAHEIDMVVDLGLVKEGDWRAVEEDVAAVRAACPGRTLKVILETAALTGAEIVTGCQVAEAAGADYVKTSTGFHPAGGASREAVALMARTVGGRLGVKASGGIRDAAWAVALLQAGATRLGCSGTAALLAGLDAPRGSR
jgi:deoxyribose-phosphate aldolase